MITSDLTTSEMMPQMSQSVFYRVAGMELGNCYMMKDHTVRLQRG